MKKEERTKGSIIQQVTAFFLLGVLATGLITFVSQHHISDSFVKSQLEDRASNIAEEVKLAIEEYPAYDWLMPIVWISNMTRTFPQKRKPGRKAVCLLNAIPVYR